MTIASEITRLQWAKASAKASIEAKWVSVPTSASVEDYHTYIDLINTGVIVWLFTPVTLSNTFYMYNAFFDKDLWDIVRADESEYFRFFWFRERKSTSIDYRHVWVWTKKHHVDQVFTYNSTWVEEPSNWFLEQKWFRQKRDGNNIKASVLYYTARTNATRYWYCYNITNTTISSPVSLWTTPAWSSDPSAEILTAWTTSCEITADESIPSINATSMDIVRQEAGVFSAVATLNV